MQPSNKLTAPSDIWNNYDVARSKPDSLQAVRLAGITATVLAGWHERPELHEHIRTTLSAYQRHPETC